MILYAKAYLQVWKGFKNIIKDTGASGTLFTTEGFLTDIFCNSVLQILTLEVFLF
jgi:hypothetical protein